MFRKLLQFFHAKRREPSMFLRVPAFFLFALFCFRQPHLYDGSVIFIHIGARNARPFAVHQRQAAFYIGRPW